MTIKIIFSLLAIFGLLLLIAGKSFFVPGILGIITGTFIMYWMLKRRPLSRIGKRLVMAVVGFAVILTIITGLYFFLAFLFGAGITYDDLSNKKIETKNVEKT